MKRFVFTILTLFASLTFANQSTSHSTETVSKPSTPDSSRHWHNNWSTQINLSELEVRCYPIRSMSMFEEGDPSSSSQFQWIVDKAQSALQISFPRCLGENSMNALAKQIQYEMANNGYASSRVTRPAQDLHSGHLAFSVSSVVTQPTAFKIEEVSTEQYEQSISNSKTSVESTTNQITASVSEDKIEPQPFSASVAMSTTKTAIQTADMVQDNSVASFAHQTILTTQPIAQLLSAPLELAPLYLGKNLENKVIYPELVAEQAVVKQVNTAKEPKLSFNQTPIGLLSGRFGLKVYGSPSVGNTQGDAELTFHDILTKRDAFNISFAHELKFRDSDTNKKYDRQFEFGYHLPFGLWALDFSHQENRLYQQIFYYQNNQVAYGFDTKREQVSLSFRAFDTKEQKLTASVGMWTRKSKDYLYSNTAERMFGWTTGLSYEGKLKDDSLLKISSSYSQGKLSHANRLTLDDTGRPRILSVDLNWTLPFNIANQSFQFNTEWKAQWSKKALNVQDKFSVGGLNTLRGFNSRFTLAGDKAWLTRNEISWKVKGTDKSVYAALDVAKVTNKIAQQKVAKKASSVAIGVKGTKNGFEYDLFVGKPISKPKGVKASKHVVGVNINYRF